MTGYLRILHVAEAFGGGLYQVVRTIAERHADGGHAVAIAFGRRPVTPAGGTRLVDANVELFPIEWVRASPISHLKAALHLRKLVDEWRPDVVHLHSSFAGLAGSLTLRGRVPLIFSPHALASLITNNWALVRVYRSVERWIMRRCQIVGAVSETEATAARRLGATDVVTVLNGIAELDDPAGRTCTAGHSRLVVAGGRLVDQRRPAACARILSCVADEADVMWIGGPGPGDRRDAAEPLMRSRIPMTGWVPRDEALKRLAAATVYLHWTRGDGTPISVLEALALDVITVASDISPNRELLGSGQVCATEDEAVRLIKRVLNDTVVAEDLVASQRRIRPMYSARAMAQGWMMTYKRVAAEWRAGS